MHATKKEVDSKVGDDDRQEGKNHVEVEDRIVES